MIIIYSIYQLSQQLGKRQYFRQTTVTKQKLIKHMQRNIMTRAQLKLVKMNQLQPKADKTKPNTKARQEQEKQDKPDTINIQANQKVVKGKENEKKIKPVNKEIKVKVNEVFIRQRIIIVSCYSKLQSYFKLRMESLILAVEIFDKYTDCLFKLNQMLDKNLMMIALACFMMAIKYEEIYPPSLQEIQYRMNIIRLNFKDYVQTQFHILDKLQYNIAFPSPISYLKKFSQTKDKKTLTYFYLEIAILNIDIKNTYDWCEVTEAIQFTIQNSLSIKEESRQKINPRIEECSEQLIKESHNLDGNYSVLEKKYLRGKFYKFLDKENKSSSDEQETKVD